MCSSWVNKGSHKNTTKAKYGKVYIHSDKKIFTLDSSFQISRHATKPEFWIYEFPCEQKTVLSTKLFWSCLLKCKRSLKWIYIHNVCITERGQYTAILTEQAWSINDLLNGLRHSTLSWGKNAGNPKQARWVHLAPSGSQSEHRIHFILPAPRFSNIINSCFDPTKLGQ